MVDSVKGANKNLVTSIKSTVSDAVLQYEKLKKVLQDIKAITAPPQGPDNRSLKDVAGQYNITDPTAGSFVDANPVYGRSRYFYDPASVSRTTTNSRTSNRNQSNNFTFNITSDFKNEEDMVDAVTKALKSGAQFA